MAHSGSGGREGTGGRRDHRLQSEKAFISFSESWMAERDINSDIVREWAEKEDFKSGVRNVSSLILEESMHFFDMPKETIINIWRMGVKAD